MELSTYNRKQYQAELSSHKARLAVVKELINEATSPLMKNDYIKEHNMHVRRIKKIQEILIEDVAAGAR